MTTWVGGKFVLAMWLSPERGSGGLVQCPLWCLGRFNSVLLNSALLASFISLIASPITRSTFRTYSFNWHRAHSHLSHLSIISRNICPQLHEHSHSLCATCRPCPEIWQPHNKPLSEPMMVRLLTHTCITQPQWIGLDLLNDDTCPSGHISRPTQVNVSQSCFHSLNNYSSLIILYTSGG